MARRLVAVLLASCCAIGTQGQFTYSKGDFLSASDRDVSLSICDGEGSGTSRTLGSYLDEGKALMIDKSYHT